MSLSILLKSLLATALHNSGLLARRLGRLPDSSVILMYHRVIPRDRAEAGMQPGMYVEPASFAMQLEFLAKYFTVVPLAELLSSPFNAGQNGASRPRCAITFDDGWVDFYDHAFPLLQRFSLPTTVFLPTDFIGTSDWFWTDRLTRLVLMRAAEQSHLTAAAGLSELLYTLLALSGPVESQVEAAIHLLKPLRNEEIEEPLTGYAALLGTSSASHDRAFLSWEEVAEMQRSGLISFGSHTAGHRILTTLTATEVREELDRSKQALLAHGAVSPEFIPFCYPNGNFDEQIAAMVRECGYSLAVTTREGWNDSKSLLFTLNRVAIHEDMTSTAAMFGCRIAGII